MLAPAGTPISFLDTLKAEYYYLFGSNLENRIETELDSLLPSNSWFAVNTGRAALALILHAIKETTGKNEIILPAYTCFSVPSAIRQVGMKVRLVDLSPNSFCFDIAKLEAAITDQTAAVLLIYPFNLAIDPTPVVELARRYKVPVIEDAAQSMGLRINGKAVGTFGDVALFSLSKGKAITSIRGGLIATSNQAIANSIRQQMEAVAKATFAQSIKIRIEMEAIFWALRPSLFGLIAALPFVKLGETHYQPDFAITRMPKMAQALLIPMLVKLGRVNQQRATVAGWYKEELGGAHWPVLVPREYEHAQSLYLRLPLLLSTAAKTSEAHAVLRSLGGSRMYHDPLPVIDDAALFAGPHATTDFPNAASLASRLLTLPTHSYVNRSHVAKSAAIIQRMLG